MFRKYLLQDKAPEVYKNAEPAADFGSFPEKARNPMTPISIHPAPEFIKLLEMDPVPDIDDETLPDNWTNFYRRDDWSGSCILLSQQTQHLFHELNIFKYI